MWACTLDFLIFLLLEVGPRRCPWLQVWWYQNPPLRKVCALQTHKYFPSLFYKIICSHKQDLGFVILSPIQFHVFTIRKSYICQICSFLSLGFFRWKLNSDFLEFVKSKNIHQNPFTQDYEWDGGGFGGSPFP